MDRDELRRLYNEYADGIYRYLKQLSRSEETAFDLLQETFLRADRYYREVRNEKAWLYRIAHNLFLDFRGKEREIISDASEEIADQTGAAFTDDVHWELLKKEILKKLREGNEMYPRIFLLRLDHDLTHKEIADILQSSDRTIRRHFEKIKNIIAANFSRELFGEKKGGIFG